VASFFAGRARHAAVELLLGVLLPEPSYLGILSPRSPLAPRVLADPKTMQTFPPHVRVRFGSNAAFRL
jgi:hypothetical protein